MTTEVRSSLLDMFQSYQDLVARLEPVIMVSFNLVANMSPVVQSVVSIMKSLIRDLVNHLVLIKSSVLISFIGKKCSAKVSLI